ncbi:MAG: cytochrome b/b6 domain-containing protein, partial [Pseudomonadota bacterium]
LIPVPNLPLPVNDALSDWFGDVHEIISKATIALIFLHVGAALKHHFINRDDILSRMVPFIRPRA